MESGLYKKYIGSPCNKNGIDPKLMVDSVKKAITNKDFNELQAVNKIKDVDLNDPEQYRDEYKGYVKRKKEGYVEDNSADGMPNVNIPANPNSMMDYNKFSTSKEIARGGKRGVKALRKQQMVDKVIKAGKLL